MRIRGKATKRRRGLPVGVAIAFVVATLTTGLAANTASGQAEAVPPNTAYVQQVFQDLLGRAVDPGGLNYWTGQLNAGVPRSAVSWWLVNSDEYRSDVIAGMYQSFLNRATDPGGLHYWVGQVGSGMTFEWFQSYLIGSAEYYSLPSKGKSNNTDFVKSMYHDVLGRNVDPGGLNYFVSLLNAGAPRAQVVSIIVFSPEHLATTVDGYYQHFLGRHSDPGGQNFWVGQLQAGARDETIVALIIGSDEYYLRVNGGHLPPPTTTTTTTAPPTTTTTVGSDPRAATGQWSGAIASGGTVMQHAVLVPGTSQVLFFEDGAGAKILNTANGAITPEPAANNMFCAGQTVLADGRVLVLGGDAAGNPEYGSVATNIYNPATGSFSQAAAMHAIRWYPTGTKLPDGRILSTGGTNSGVVQQTPEIYNPANNTWTLMSTSANLNIAYYPFMYVLPDGRLVEVGSFGINGVPVQVLNLGSQTWSTVDGRAIPAGSATMYRPGKILRAGVAGGPGTTGQPGSAAAYTLDMTSGAPTLRAAASMANARTFLNMTTLPDGNVLVTGGDRTHDLTSAAGAVYAAEEWSPVTGQWKTLASNSVPRFYHSVAVTLPDGRVLVGGGWGGDGGDGVRQRTYEIFSPPYLFKGARPSITSAPGGVGYGGGFTIGTPDASRIASVVLTAPAAVTHNFDQNARYVPLNFSVGAGGLQVTAPANGNLAPPGPYLLWIVDSNGVPSVASWITIG